VPTVTVNGIELYFERWGEGPPLLFLNGSGTTLDTTRPMIDPFAEHFEVVAHDQRGLGRSAVPPGPYSMAEYAADAAALLDHVGWETARVVGISFGGMVAQELAVTWPQRVERLALLCTSPGGAGGASYPLHELDRMPDAERVALRARLLDGRFTPEWLSDHPGDRAIVELVTSHEPPAPDSDVARGMAAQLDARSRHDVCARLSRIECPTFVASGRYDLTAPVANGEAIASRVPNAELRVYEGGHIFFMQDPQAYADTMEFLAGE
jgi:pimeloyl-ACP methyl ester carboxylesterase